MQLDFLGDEAQRIKTERLESAIDGLRRRFGHQIVRRAVVLTDGQYAQINPKEEHTVHPVPFTRGKEEKTLWRQRTEGRKTRANAM